MKSPLSSISKLDLRAWMSVVRAHNLCSEELLFRLKPLGLKLPHLEVLVSLLHRSRQSQQELARGSFVVKSRMSSLLAEMERNGLITRFVSPVDKRSTLVVLTGEGMARATQVASIQAGVVKLMLKPLNVNQIKEVDFAMRSVATALKARRDS
jgi:DNA-binding MarR family transcriptional regulator